MKASALLIMIIASCIAGLTVGIDIEQLLSQMTLKEKIGQTTQIEVSKVRSIYDVQDKFLSDLTL